MSAAELGIRRKKFGKGFAYYYASGRKVNAQRVLKRIDRLVIPPNWQDVQIASEPSADLQVTGYDQKNRKQYIYHPDWHKRQQAAKFSRLAEFGQVLPDFRQACWQWVDQPDWQIDKTLALVCLLLDHTGLRIGNRQYTQQNQTYGLTTLRRKHVQQADSQVSLSFVGKHNKPRQVDIEDPELADLVSQSAQERGYALFRYEDERGRWHDVDSDDVNQFIHQHLGEQYSCKDFRTWGASRFALLSLPDIEQQILQNQRRSWPATLTKHVAQMLGNTPTVCRQYYLHPHLFRLVESEQHRQPMIEQMNQILANVRIADESISQTEQILGQIIAEKAG